MAVKGQKKSKLKDAASAALKITAVEFASGANDTGYFEASLAVSIFSDAEALRTFGIDKNPENDIRLQIKNEKDGLTALLSWEYVLLEDDWMKQSPEDMFETKSTESRIPLQGQALKLVWQGLCKAAAEGNLKAGQLVGLLAERCQHEIAAVSEANMDSFVPADMAEKTQVRRARTR